MVIHPEIQRKAQQQLDEVLGYGRLPSLEDRPNLPYLEAVYRELIRWKVPAPIGLAHVSTQDDYYEGYYIPKGMWQHLPYIDQSDRLKRIDCDRQCGVRCSMDWFSSFEGLTAT